MPELDGAALSLLLEALTDRKAHHRLPGVLGLCEFARSLGWQGLAKPLGVCP